MAAKSTKEADVSCGLNARYHNWTIEHATEAVDVTTYDDSGHRTLVPGIDSWSGSVEGFVDGATTCAMPTAAVSGTFTDSGDTSVDLVYTGNMIITGVTYGAPVRGAASITISFEGTGALTQAAGS